MRSLLVGAALALAGCATAQAPEAAADRFFANLGALCGRSYEGRLVSTDAAGADFAGKRLVMQVRDCGAEEVRIRFSVGADHSRTWVVTRTPTGLRLKHDHRHEDGTPDVLTMYGGDSVDAGTATRQEFPADAESKALFTRENIPASTGNVWALEVQPERVFAYELRRPGRNFRLEFDLAPPLPER